MALGIASVCLRDQSFPRFFANLAPDFTDNFEKIKDPGLALVLSLELARNKQNVTYLDSLVSQHQVHGSGNSQHQTGYLPTWLR